LEKNEFKKIVNQYLKTQGFMKKGSYYYKESEEMKFVFGLQKSNFSNGYYVNLGIFIKELHKEIEFPRDIDGDVYLRCYVDENEEFDLIDLDYVDGVEPIIKLLNKSIEQFVFPAITYDGFLNLLESDPSLINVTTLKAKQFLGIEH
jgi:hypothetical protein